MFAGVAKTVVGAARGQICVGEKEQNCRRQSIAVVRLNDQSVFAVNDDFRNIADSCRNDRSAAGKRFAQNNGRRFGVARCDYNHVRGRKNIRNVPAISHH